jgi:IMP dehydrogenase
MATSAVSPPGVSPVPSSNQTASSTGLMQGSGLGSTAHPKIVADGITFDDVLILPRRSAVMPAEAETSARLTRQIRIKIPLISAPMDTVTESRMAVALAQQGGIGIVHKNLTVERQVLEVDKVKRSANGVIQDPVALAVEDTVGRAKDLMQAHKISGLPVVDAQRVVVGILTHRDLRFVDDRDTKVGAVMTRQNLVKARPAPRSTRRARSCARTRSRS